MKRGLDNRSQDKNGQIREKNGAAKIGNMTPEYPELRIFKPQATLTQVKRNTGLGSLDEVRRYARSEIRKGNQ